MNDRSDPDVESFAGRIRQTFSRSGYRRLRADLSGRSDRGAALLSALMRHTSQDVRSWAANVARKDLGRDAIPCLEEMARSPRIADQDEAMQQLEAIDRELLRPFIPAMRRIFRRSTDLSGPGGAAMWRLVRLGDRDSATLFRAFAEGRDPRWYEHRMPLVLADRIEQPGSLVQRIASHDHEWMLWLATAARQLDAAGAEAALRDGARSAPDPECRRICQEELEELMRDRQRPHPSWDIES
ncbi:MAG TPA: hypothetical protein VK871_11900 [Candidatus Limnocylindrales bacterium]|nr:hypothetical protein [Candidatus Limnocylindrales bacterium]